MTKSTKVALCCQFVLTFKYISCMTITEHVQYWLDTTLHDWEAAESLQANNQRSALIFVHWTLEKLSKALWVRENQKSITPGEGTDDVAVLLTETSFTLSPAQTAFVTRLKALHDGIVEYDPEQPVVSIQAPETQETLIAQANELRQQLLEKLSQEAA
jgi:hypothetical protein